MIRHQQDASKPQRMVQVRGANRALVLQILRKHPQLSRAELSRRSGLSEGTISRITAELLAEKVILEQGAENSTGGRPGLRLELNQTHFRSVGVEIHDWETRVSVGTLHGQVLETQWFRTPSSAKKTLDAVAAHVTAGRKRHGMERVHGVGVSVRGIVDDQSGVVDIGITPEWSGLNVRQYLEDKLGLPVYVENNVRAAALAEYSYGNSEIHNSRCMALVKVDEGIGAGILLDGQLYRGPRRAAGEFGQMVVADSPGAGAHDRAGCLESLAANPAIVARYAALCNDRRSRAGETESRVRTICHLAMEGDEAAITAIRESMRYLGIGIANLVWGLDMDVILIDGAITEAWPLVHSALQEQFPGREYPNFRDLILRPCALGQDASIVGALTLPFLRLFATGHAHRKTAVMGK
jgi:predicted NBD/HSP70 family sugar kinase